MSRFFDSDLQIPSKPSFLNIFAVIFFIVLSLLIDAVDG
jgi:hypothetical protein